MRTFLCLVAMCSTLTISAQRERWLVKAEEAKPQLRQTIVEPSAIVVPAEDKNAFQRWRMKPISGTEPLFSQSMKKRGEVIVDFGRHLTGHLSFSLRSLFSVQDAAIRLRFTFGEVPGDLMLPYEPFNGTLSRGWLQDVAIDVMPQDTLVTIKRRTACRYVKIEVLGSSQYFDFAFDRLYITATTSAGESKTVLAHSTPQTFRAICHTAETTLAECMQTVYEDGPKRDQRLWTGDLYLEALANSVSFKNFGLTRRCLYLLAGLSDAECGLIYSNCFERPWPHAQKSFFADYALEYNLTLLDYLSATGDRETAEELWPVARQQVDALLQACVKNGRYDASAKPEGVRTFVIFFDWNDALDRQAAIQMMMPYAIDKTYELACRIGHEKEVGHWPKASASMKATARRMRWKPSYTVASWAVIAGIYKGKEAKRLMEKVMADTTAVRPKTPYAWHFVVQALIHCGLDNAARHTVNDVWGKMVDMGADTFWEAYDENDHLASPYHFAPLNSYCHAWSCTPMYFIQKYPEIFQKQESK